MHAKKLTLKKETLAELTSDQLRMVFGGAAGTDSCSCTSCGCSCQQQSCNAAEQVFAALNAFVAVDC